MGLKVVWVAYSSHESGVMVFVVRRSHVAARWRLRVLQRSTAQTDHVLKVITA